MRQPWGCPCPGVGARAPGPPGGPGRPTRPGPVPPGRTGGTWLAIKALPLCIPLAGILKNRMYTYRWVSLVIWLYFTEGVVRGWSDKPPSQWLAWAEVALCLVLFTACTLHVGLRQRNARAAAAAAQP